MIYSKIKMHTVLLLLIFITSCLSLSNCLFAENSYRYSDEKNNVQFAIYPDLQIVDRSQKVYGFRFSFPISENLTMIGLDIGGGSRNTEYFYGLGANLFGTVNDRNAEGVSLNCLFAFTGNNFTGFTFAGLFNKVFHRITGVQASVISSWTEQISGVQISLVNYCEDLNGAQIGLLNFNNNGTIPFTILFNYDDNFKSK